MPEPPPRDLVVEALTLPAAPLRAWAACDWGLLVRQARGAGLLGRVGQRLRGLFAGAEAPPWPRAFEAHLAAAERLMGAQRDEVRRELAHLSRALANLGAPVVLLKGAAYLAAGLPPGAARVFSDIDLLVPKAALSEAESSLMLAGWMGTHQNDYDQRYYREWMHELPPMQHVHRGTAVDVHHNILPTTARFRPSGAKLVAAAVPVPEWPGLHVLGRADMVLHSATHLFMNEEMSHALRDLSDLDLLLRHFGSDAGFWAELEARAAEQDLNRPLHYALRHAARQLATPVPPGVLARSARRGPGPALRPLMDALWSRMLRSQHPRAALRGTAAARFAVYVRGHWLRMPPLLLARHLSIKALRLNTRPLPGAHAAAPTQG